MNTKNLVLWFVAVASLVLAAVFVFRWRSAEGRGDLGSAPEDGSHESALSKESMPSAAVTQTKQPRDTSAVSNGPSAKRDGETLRRKKGKDAQDMKSSRSLTRKEKRRMRHERREAQARHRIREEMLAELEPDDPLRAELSKPEKVAKREAEERRKWHDKMMAERHPERVEAEKRRKAERERRETEKKESMRRRKGSRTGEPVIPSE